jgi:beta-lactamase superfamily II metal-dependent hydrolase
MRTSGITAFLILLCALSLPAAQTLDIWVVDTEGGQAVLMVAPSGQTLLMDSGYPGNGDRDTNRIVEACKAAGVKKLDTLVTTHYDVDHAGNLASLLARIPAAVFVDHGDPMVEMPQVPFDSYKALTDKGKRLVVKPGDKIPFGGVDVLVVTAAGKVLDRGGTVNPACSGVQKKTGPRYERPSENAGSIGLLFTFEEFRMLDMGDLLWNQELALMCPTNRVGPVDLFIVSHHGLDWSNSPALVKAIQSRVAIMSNGPAKGGSPDTFKVLKSAPGMQALYSHHRSDRAPDDNLPDEYVANLPSSPDGNGFKVSVQPDSTFTVTNLRTGVMKTFKK